MSVGVDEDGKHGLLDVSDNGDEAGSLRESYLKTTAKKK